jgi:hypothetical protein
MDVDATRAELDHQLQWFDTHATRARMISLLIRVVTASAAATIAFLITLPGVPGWIPAVMALGISVLQIIDGATNQQSNWLRYRETTEELRAERTLYDARAGAYAAERPQAVLAERLNEIRLRERNRWTEWAKSQDQSIPPGPPAS